MRYAADNDIGVRISSNLSMRDFSDEQVDKVLNAGIEHLIVSCHGASQESYEKYMVGGNFERVIANLKKLVARRNALGRKLPFIDWQFLLFRHNQHEVPKARQMAEEIGVDLLRLIYPNIPPEFKDEWRPRPEGEATDYHPVPEQKPAAKSAPAPQSNGSNGNGQAARAKGPKINVERCSWPYRSIYFNWDGGILPCCDGTTRPSFDLGKFDANLTIDAIWNGPDYQNVRRYANFEIAPQDMDKRYTCASCLKPLAPFLIKQKGLPLHDAVDRKISATLAAAKNPYQPVER
jgi:MoaA/NifB/PqqE/SkfB family radical SAM enzyme